MHFISWNVSQLLIQDFGAEWNLPFEETEAQRTCSLCLAELRVQHTEWGRRKIIYEERQAQFLEHAFYLFIQ